MKELDLHYIAGFFDGEGSIIITHKIRKEGYHDFALVVQIGQTNLEILESLQQQFGGSIAVIKTRSPKHKQAWLWSIAAIKALSFLKQITPFLVLKKDEAELAIKYQEEVSAHPGGLRLTIEDISHREEMKKGLQELKWRT